MDISIMQPTYLPWTGYFNLITKVALFILLDDVEFSYQSWQQRNRIVANAAATYLTVPVLTKGRSRQLIREVEVDDSKHWRRKHIQTLRQAYARCPAGGEVTALVESVLNQGQPLLADINMEVIRQICRELGIACGLRRSSELQVEGERSERLVEICRRVGAAGYLSPVGSRDYIEQDGVFARCEIGLKYQEYTCAPYPQRGVKEFISHMSIVDLLANVGFEEARKYVTGTAQHVPSAV